MDNIEIEKYRLITVCPYYVINMELLIRTRIYLLSAQKNLKMHVYTFGT